MRPDSSWEHTCKSQETPLLLFATLFSTKSPFGLFSTEDGSCAVLMLYIWPKWYRYMQGSLVGLAHFAVGRDVWAILNRHFEDVLECFTHTSVNTLEELLM